MTRINLIHFPLVGRLLRSRYPQFAIVLLLLGGYLFAIMAGLIGSKVGSANFDIVFVWIAWWAILVLIAVPLLGRGWCSVCPIPAPGEWLQRGAVLGPFGNRGRGLRLRWPRPLRNLWIQSGLFLLLALFSIVLLTTPWITAVVLAAMLLAAIGLSLVFERRTFCRYVCPVGGFIGLYSQAAPMELRVADRSICTTCDDKPCYNGSVEGYGCPWNTFPGGMTRNTYCGLCLECVRSCPRDNVALNLRPFGADLRRPTGRLDEAFKAFIMLGSAVLYSAVLLGPWGALKNAAFRIGSPAWVLYAIVFLALVGLVLPGIFALCVGLDGDVRTLRHRFASMSVGLIPLGLTSWIAFSLSFASSNGSYVAAVISDPLGLGWNLLGTAHVAWQPILTAGLAPSQAVILAGGALWSTNLSRDIAAKLKISPLPAVLYCIAVTLILLWLLL